MKKVIFILGFIIFSFCSYSQSKTDFQKKALAGLTFSFDTTIVRGTMTIVNPNDDNYYTQQKNIFFVINKWDIRDSEALKLDEIVSALKENSDALVKISGYADKDTGTAKRNKFLSEKRSEMVANYLINHGIDKSRIKSIFYSDTIFFFDTPEENRVGVCLINNK